MTPLFTALYNISEILPLDFGGSENLRGALKVMYTYRKPKIYGCTCINSMVNKRYYHLRTPVKRLELEINYLWNNR